MTRSCAQLRRARPSGRGCIFPFDPSDYGAAIGSFSRRASPTGFSRHPDKGPDQRHHYPQDHCRERGRTPILKPLAQFTGIRPNAPSEMRE